MNKEIIRSGYTLKVYAILEGAMPLLVSDASIAPFPSGTGLRTVPLIEDGKRGFPFAPVGMRSWRKSPIRGLFSSSSPSLPCSLIFSSSSLSLSFPFSSLFLFNLSFLSFDSLSFSSLSLFSLSLSFPFSFLFRFNLSSLSFDSLSFFSLSLSSLSSLSLSSRSSLSLPSSLLSPLHTLSPVRVREILCPPFFN